MIKTRLFAVFTLLTSLTFAQGPYAPAAGQPGSTAIAMDSSIIRSWATGAEVVRGYIQISDTGVYNLGSNKATYGRHYNAMGPGEGTSTGVVSLGDGGVATLTFDRLIVNGPGPDFAVFENSFGDTFLELAFVEVSSDGVNYSRFPSVSLTPSDVQKGAWDELDPTMLHNLAGKYRQGFGTPFDLSDLEYDPMVDLFAVRFVRILDAVGCIDPEYATFDSEGHIVNEPFPTPFNSGGFDLDGVAVINANVLNEVAGFEDLNLEPDSYFLPESAGNFTSGSLSFLYEGSSGSWSGFTYSNRVTLNGTYNDDQFVAVSRGGIEADSSVFAITYVSSDWMTGTYDPIPSVIQTTDESEVLFGGFYVANTDMAYITMRDGTLFNKKFGGESGNDPDWFRLKVWGLRADNSLTQEITHYLADFRNEDNALDYIQDDWRWVDLQPLGAVKSLHFILESSDSGDYGINTPAYFCMDNLTVLNTQGPVLTAWLPDHEVAVNADPVTVMLDDYFYSVQGDLAYEIAGNSNPELIAAEITGNQLLLTFSADASGSGEVSVVATAAGLSVTDIFNVSVLSNVGIVSPETFTFRAYPNPVSGSLFIENGAQCELQLTGMNGKMVLETMLLTDMAEVSLAGLQPGIYLLKLISEKGVSIKKIVKQ